MKLKRKLTLYYLIAALLTLFLVGCAVLQGIQRLSINTIEAQLIDQSKLAEIYISQMYALQNGEYNELSADTATRVVGKLGLILGNIHVYDRKLNLQAASKGDMGDHISDSENMKVLNAALEGSYAYFIRNNTVYFSSPIEVDEKTIGVLEIIYPLDFLENLMSGVTHILLIGSLVFVLLMAFLSIYIAGRLAKPINQLVVAADNYANRVFTPVEIKSSDEISKLCRSFNEMGAQLQDYIQRQKQFTANVSHELRTPLTAIRGYSELLMEEMKNRPELEKVFYHLENETKRLAKLIDEVLTLSRIDNDSESFEFKRMNLSDFIRDMNERMRGRAGKYHIQLIAEVEPDVYIWGDTEKLVQVIINVLDNALKFSPPESTVRMKLIKEVDMALISIMDEGIGIPQEDRSKVFERFYRARNAHGVSGTGLGLAIVKYIVEAHRGSIELLTGPEGGTLVNLRLPVQI